MKEITYDQLKETLYYEKLDNGLDVYILPKHGFSKTYATFTTKYGSVDNHFKVPGKDQVKVPDGIAHFLEHKMFEEEEGGDVFNKFATYGASANAFTSFDRTAYLFSSTGNVKENLTTLLDFVQSPYFTEENVEKEKGIIGQEIKMYDDNADWRVYFGLIQNMYHHHPVQIDIAGTIPSITEITKDMLYTCYETFYHPSNMLLFIVGAVEPKEILNLVRENQAKKNYQAQEEIERFFEDEPTHVDVPQTIKEMTVAMPKVMFGYKEKEVGLVGDDLLKRELTTQLVLDILLGQSSNLYQSLYEEGLINDTFGTDYSGESKYGFSVMGGDTPDPEKLVKMITEGLEAAKEKGIETDEFELNRKKKIGSFLRSLNSIEFVANSFTKYKFNGSDLFHIVPTLEQITLADVNNRLRDHIQKEQLSVSIIKPLKRD
ncbi:pitrilysin family protein [Ammoniphilus sp. CFH 90114]|uniref:EF-P 5-aminopentanol modification-associated protein YfmH n=1 Tax=Ammoniphilus sp. CFH 90114 TaxID=2493665 RepID=UPI00100E31DE|nr:pitrilysin family protein [Ammoniphilus sp. CFH 90114]RXT15177.1 insulinase family protein [Ammoniphilus sp. CFH 90114]